MPVVHYNSGIFYAWIDGILTIIPISGGGSSSSNSINLPYLINEENEHFEPILFGQQSLDNVAYRNRTNAFTGANSFASSPLDLLIGQLKFPASQNASSDVNTLDDYEEGTWTPTIGGSTSQSGQTYTTQAGFYTKVGRFVSANFFITLSNAGTITGVVEIKGLPFVVANLTNNYGVSGGYFDNLATAYSSFNLQTRQNNTVLRFLAVPAGGAVSTTFLLQADISNTTTVIATVAYHTTT